MYDHANGAFDEHVFNDEVIHPVVPLPDKDGNTSGIAQDQVADTHVVGANVDQPAPAAGRHGLMVVDLAGAVVDTGRLVSAIDLRLLI